MYTDEEELKDTKVVKVSGAVHELLRRERNRLRKEGRHVSMAKLASNAIIQQYAKTRLPQEQTSHVSYTVQKTNQIQIKRTCP